MLKTPLEQGLECIKAKNFDAAIKHLEKATSSFPEDYHGFNYLGIAYAQKGLYNRAIGAFLAALKMRPNTASIHYNVALAYRANGFNDHAKNHLEKALFIDPVYEKARAALEALDEHIETDDSLWKRACARHTDEPAVALCSFCMLPVCKACKNLIEGNIYCNRCAEKFEAKK